jgi:hypothetical protein
MNGAGSGAEPRIPADLKVVVHLGDPGDEGVVPVLTLSMVARPQPII